MSFRNANCRAKALCYADKILDIIAFAPLGSAGFQPCLSVFNPFRYVRALQNLSFDKICAANFIFIRVATKMSWQKHGRDNRIQNSQPPQTAYP
jgi:hypothetical protein